MRGKYYPNQGILLEPNNLVLYHDKFVYLTVTLQDPILNLEYNIIKNCNAPDKVSDFEYLLKGDKLDYLSFLNQLPISLGNLNDHYCANQTIDCFLDDVYTEQQNKVSSSHIRTKRAPVLAIVAAIGGLIAVGLAIKNAISVYNIEESVDRIEKNQYRIYLTLTKSTDTINKFEKIDKYLYLNIDHTIKDVLDHLHLDLCLVDTRIDIISVFFNVKSYISQKKQGILRMLDGKWSPELLNSVFIYNFVLKHPLLADTVFIKDPGLLYLIASSFFLKYDESKGITYFLLSIPVINQKDVSPLFSVYNVGYIFNNINHMYDIPRKIYFATGDNQFHAVDMDQEECKDFNGLLLCSTRYKSLNKKTKCLQDVLRQNDNPSCDIILNKNENYRDIITTRGGVLVKGTYEISKIKTIRHGLARSYEAIIKYNDSVFIPYSEFELLKIDDLIIRSISTSIFVDYHDLKTPEQIKINDSFASIYNRSHSKSLSYLHELDQLHIEPVESLIFYDKMDHSYIIGAGLFGILLLIIIIMLWFKRKNYSNSKVVYLKTRTTLCYLICTAVGGWCELTPFRT